MKIKIKFLLLYFLINVYGNRFNEKNNIDLYINIKLNNNDNKSEKPDNIFEKIIRKIKHISDLGSNKNNEVELNCLINHYIVKDENILFQNIEYQIPQLTLSLYDSKINLFKNKINGKENKNFKIYSNNEYVNLNIKNINHIHSIKVLLKNFFYYLHNNLNLIYTKDLFIINNKISKEVFFSLNLNDKLNTLKEKKFFKIKLIIHNILFICNIISILLDNNKEVAFITNENLLTNFNKELDLLLNISNKIFNLKLQKNKDIDEIKIILNENYIFIKDFYKKLIKLYSLDNIYKKNIFYKII